MKAKSFQLNALTNQIRNEFDVILLYGTDEGEIDYTLTQLKKILNISSQESNLTVLSKEDFKALKDFAKKHYRQSSRINLLSDSKCNF